MGVGTSNVVFKPILDNACIYGPNGSGRNCSNSDNQKERARGLIPEASKLDPVFQFYRKNEYQPIRLWFKTGP